ncbi:MAG: extracellular solute-binding protein [Eubacterium sp.]|nr:extracellular solute-binding protein [Eubacterium sp.]
MKKRVLSVLTVAGLAVGLLAGCGSQEAPNAGNTSAQGSAISERSSKGSTITVINYGEYIDKSVLRQFEAETGIEVKYEECVNPEEMYSKYIAGAIDYDLICSSEYIIERLIQEGHALEIDKSQMEYVDNIGDKYWEICQVFDPENQYAIPYFYGTVGLLYNEDLIKGEIDSWEVLFNGEYAGEIIMSNNVRDALMIAEKYLGYSLNTTDRDEIDTAFELLIDQKKDVEAYFVDEVREEMVAENASIAVCYSGETYLANEYNEKLQYVVPKEGSNLWVDCWMLPKSATNVEGALLFLDFLCREDIAMKNFEYVYYPSPNEAVLAQLDEETLSDPFVFPDEEAFENCEVYRQLDTDTIEYYSAWWKELKSVTTFFWQQ